MSQKEKDLILILAASQNDLDSFKEIELMGANLQGTNEGCHGCDSLFNACYNGSKGKSLSEGLILATINPKYDNSLFIELRVQYKKTTNSEHVVYIKLLKPKTILCTRHLLNL